MIEVQTPKKHSSEHQNLTIDPRSFHVFEFSGDRLLFDRATGTTSELSPLAFEVLHAIRQGEQPEDVLKKFALEFGDSEAASMRLALSDLIDKGMFRFSQSLPATDEDLEYLWKHKPRRIQLLMAEGCNLGCRYCYQWRNGTNQRHTLMPWNIARDAVNHLVWRSGGRKDIQVTFFGGEPLLNYPMVKRVVEYCKSIEDSTDKSFVFELITNGTLLERDVVDFLVEHRFLLFISLDGWKEMHEYNRPAIDADESHETIVKNALYANEQYTKHKLTPIKIRANLTNRYHDARRVEEYFIQLGFRLMGVGAIEPLPHGDPSPASMTEDQMDELCAQSEERAVESVRAVEHGKPLSPLDRKSITACAVPLSQVTTPGVTCGVNRNTTIVDNRGNMYPCHRYAEMKQYAVGHVSTGLDRTKVMEYYRKVNAHSTSDCQNCWIRDYCGGGCAWLLSDKDGNIHHPTPRECDRRRRGMQTKLWMRKELRKISPQMFEEKGNPSLDCWDWDTMVPPLVEEAAPDSSGLLPILGLPESGSSKEGSCGTCGDPNSGCGDCGSNQGSQEFQIVALQ